MSCVPEIRVHSPPENEKNQNKPTVFSWHSPRFERGATLENQQVRLFGAGGKTADIFFEPDAVPSDLTGAFHSLGFVRWENTFNMRSYNLNNFPTSTTSYRTAYRSQAAAMQRARLGFITGTAKSLDLLRQNMQKFINKEIDDIIQKYMEKFFKPGIENIKTNNGDNAVSDQHIQTVCRQILEEAKKMYQTSSNRGTSPAESVDLEINSFNEPKETNLTLSPKPLLKKLKESETNADVNVLPLKPKKRKGRPPNILSGRGIPMKLKLEQVKREGPKWDPARLTPEKQFIMGAKANKALGLGATRGRLYIKHPDIFKYSGDQEDKQWLYDHNLMPATGGKAYMLLVEDIKELADSEEYRNNPALLIDEIVGFNVPESMVQKMKKRMMEMRTDVVIKKRGRPPLSLFESSDNVKREEFVSGEKHSPRAASPTDVIMDFLNADMNSSDPSSFTLEKGFEDVKPVISEAPCDLNNTFDPPLSASFDIGPSTG